MSIVLYRKHRAKICLNMIKMMSLMFLIKYLRRKKK